MLGGVPVTDIRPARAAITGQRALLYAAWRRLRCRRARTMLRSSTLPLAEESGLRIPSVDYTPSPRRIACCHLGEQVLAVLAALLCTGLCT